MRSTLPAAERMPHRELIGELYLYITVLLEQKELHSYACQECLSHGHARADDFIAEATRLGLGVPVAISAETGAPQ